MSLHSAGHESGNYGSEIFQLLVVGPGVLVRQYGIHPVDQELQLLLALYALGATLYYDNVHSY